MKRRTKFKRNSENEKERDRVKERKRKRQKERKRDLTFVQKFHSNFGLSFASSHICLFLFANQQLDERRDSDINRFKKMTTLFSQHRIEMLDTI